MLQPALFDRKGGPFFLKIGDSEKKGPSLPVKKSLHFFLPANLSVMKEKGLAL